MAPSSPSPVTAAVLRENRFAIARGVALAFLAVVLGLTAASCRRSATASPAPGNSSSSSSTGTPAPAPPLPAAHAVSSGYALTPPEAGAVEDFLRRNPGLRPATDADRRGANDGDAQLKSLYGVYHPYFVRGDVNDDGVLDFVMAFVRRDLGRAAPWFSVVVFLGRGAAGGSSDFSSGTFLERDVTLARGDLSVDRDSVVITPDLDDENVRRYRWDPPGRVFVFVPGSDEDADSPSVSQTSGGGSPAVRF